MSATDPSGSPRFHMMSASDASAHACPRLVIHPARVLAHLLADLLGALDLTRPQTGLAEDGEQAVHRPEDVPGSFRDLEPLLRRGDRVAEVTQRHVVVCEPDVNRHDLMDVHRGARLVEPRDGDRLVELSSSEVDLRGPHE